MHPLAITYSMPTSLKTSWGTRRNLQISTETMTRNTTSTATITATMMNKIQSFRGCVEEERRGVCECVSVCRCVCVCVCGWVQVCGYNLNTIARPLVQTRCSRNERNQIRVDTGRRSIEIYPGYTDPHRQCSKLYLHTEERKHHKSLT